MNRGTIPDDVQLSFNMPLEVAEELNDLLPLDAAGVDLEKEPAQAQSANHRESLPTKGLLEHRCLSNRSPGPHLGETCAQSTFVDEDDGPSLWTLAAESAVAQQPPDMTRMILHAGEFFDQGCKAGERPQVGLVATTDWSRDQSREHLVGLAGGQLGLTTGLSFTGKARFTAFDPCVFPQVGDLPGHSEPSANFGSGNILLEEVSRPNPPLFHLSVVTLRWHERMARGGLNEVTLLCESQ